MNLGRFFERLPRPLAHRLIPLLPFLSLMRALELRLMGKWLRRIEGNRILNVGSGHGFYSLDLALQGARLVNCDLEAELVEGARQTAESLGLEGQLSFLTADGSALPMADGRFDAVVCNCVLEHVVDDGAALADMARALRPGGLLYLTVDNAEHGLALGLLEPLSAAIKARILWPEVAAAPTVSAGLDARLDGLFAVLRRYRREDLEQSLVDLGLAVLASRPYLTGVGAAQYEAFYALRFLDPTRGVGRLLYMLSSLILYPFAAWSDDRPAARGHGLAIVARKLNGGDRQRASVD